MFNLCKAAIVGLLIGLLGLSFVPFASDLEENIGLGLLFKLRGAIEVPSDVIIVSMDKVSAVNLNLPTDPGKWSRCLHAHLIEILVKEGAAVIQGDCIKIWYNF